MRILTAFLALIVATTSLAAQHVTVPTIPADPKDVSTVDGMMKAFYEVISGPAGQPRQWSRDRSLYIAEVRFVSMDADSAGRPVAHVMSHQQFVDRSDASLFKLGFYEQEIHRVTRSFGNISDERTGNPIPREMLP